VLNTRGQIWSEFMIGIALLVVAGFMWILLDQVYEEQLGPQAVVLGVYAPNAALIAFAWKVLLVPVLLVVVYSWVNTARKRMGAGYE
jgi:hypothetical protein